jgi:hypothetical protein
VPSGRRPGQYWSSCCGALAEYLGYYRCTGRQKPLNLGRARPPHLVGDPAEAARIRREQATAEVTPDGRLF